MNENKWGPPNPTGSEQWRGGTVCEPTELYSVRRSVSQMERDKIMRTMRKFILLLLVIMTASLMFAQSVDTSRPWHDAGMMEAQTRCPGWAHPQFNDDGTPAVQPYVGCPCKLGDLRDRTLWVSLTPSLAVCEAALEAAAKERAKEDAEAKLDPHYSWYGARLHGLDAEINCPRPGHDCTVREVKAARKAAKEATSLERPR